MGQEMKLRDEDHGGCFKRQREEWELLQPSGQRACGAQGEGPTHPGSCCGADWGSFRLALCEGAGGARKQEPVQGGRVRSAPCTEYLLQKQRGWRCLPAPGAT